MMLTRELTSPLNIMKPLSDPNDATPTAVRPHSFAAALEEECHTDLHGA